MMNNVTSAIYSFDTANNFLSFFFVTGVISFIFFLVAMFAILVVCMVGEKPADELKLMAGVFLGASFVLFLFYSDTTSSSAQKKIIGAKIATALADNSLSQLERDYLQKLAESYSLKSEAAE